MIWTTGAVLLQWIGHTCICDTGRKVQTRDLATKAKVLRCRHRDTLRGGGGTFHRGWHFPRGVDFGPYLVDFWQGGG